MTVAPDVTDGAPGPKADGALLSVRDNLANKTGAAGRSEEVEAVRAGAIGAVNAYFERRLMDEPHIRAYLDELIAREGAEAAAKH